MIRSLRQRHHRIVIILSVVLPVAFVVGIAARRPIPIVRQLPSALRTEPPPIKSIVWQSKDLFPKSIIQAQLMCEHSNFRKFAVSFSAATDFVKPDLLVYWSTEIGSATNALPDNAILLGTFASSILTLPESVENTAGRLLLYSLADNEIVDISRPIRISEAAN